MDILLEKLKNVYKERYLYESSTLSIIYHRSPYLFDKFISRKSKSFGNDSIYQPLFFKLSKEEGLSMMNAGNYLYTVKTMLIKTFKPYEMYNWDAKYTDDLDSLTNIGKEVFNTYFDSKEENIDKLFYLITGAYDAIENSDFLKWLLQNRYDSFYVSENGKFSQDKSLGIFNAENKFKILKVEKV